jgi:hypothetical protein
MGRGNCRMHGLAQEMTRLYGKGRDENGLRKDTVVELVDPLDMWGHWPVDR